MFKRTALKCAYQATDVSQSSKPSSSLTIAIPGWTCLPRESCARHAYAMFDLMTYPRVSTAQVN